MTQEELKAKITEANKAYRLGRPVMSDQAFDDLCEAYEAMVSPQEYAAFRDSLHEETGKVKHPYIMGSLDKIKAEEPAELDKWLKQYVQGSMSVSAKVDGISCRVHFEGGTFASATTRGDGTAGVDCTDKVALIGRGLPTAIGVKTAMDVRGELVIRNEDFAKLPAGFSNPRNACAGIINQKTPDPNLLRRVSFVAYEIMGGKLTKGEQFMLLTSLGFDCAWNIQINPRLPNIVDALTVAAKNDYGYPTDGLVLSSVDYKAENRYRPFAQVAFKINQLTAETEIIDVEWSDPSKDGRITPVAILRPVTIAGSTISRVTLNNLDWIKNMGVDLGCKIQLVKSGDVIPKIVKVLKQTGRTINAPATCPVCGGKTEVYGPHLYCSNPHCKGRKREEALAFIVNLGIKRIKMNTLIGWGVESLADLVKFDPAGKGKMGAYFDNELQHKLWEADETTIFKALPFSDIAETTLDKIIGQCGWDNVKAQGEALLAGNTTISILDLNNVPFGVGAKTMATFIGQLREAMEDFKLVVNNPRYAPKTTRNAATPIQPISTVTGTPAQVAVNNNPTGGTNMSTEIKAGENGSICFTGALNSMTRTEASRRARDAGFEVKNSVSAGLDYLVTNNPNSGSSKNRKAAQYGTRIITEEEFLMMIS